MSDSEKILILKIKNTKNNTFINMSHLNGQLICYKSLKGKKTKDIKIKLTWALILIFKKLKTAKIKIKFIHLYIQNMEANLIQHIFTIFKTWNIQITFLKYETPLPHNGCRRSHKSRKRNKSRRKTKEYMAGL